MVLLACALVLVNLWVVWFVRAERTIYHSDYAVHWMLSGSLAEKLRANPLGGLSSFARSVASEDRGMLAAGPIAVVMVVFGTSRLVYEVAVANLYGLTTLIALWWAVRRLGGCGVSQQVQRHRDLAVVLTAVHFLLMWRPLLLGYLDVGGVALALVVSGLYFDRPVEEQKVKTLVLIGFLLVLMALFRRWYAFWSVTFGILLVAEAAMAAWRRRCGGHAALRSAFRAPLVIGATMLISIVVLAAPMVLTVFERRYSHILSAFLRYPSFLASLAGAVEHFGLVLLAVSVACAVVLVVRPTDRRLAVVLVVQLPLILGLFRTIQDPDIHHWYLWYPGMTLIVAHALARLLESTCGSWLRRLLVSVALALGSLLGLAVFSQPVGERLARLRPLVSSRVVWPKVRGDLDEIRRLLQLLDARVAPSRAAIDVLSMHEGVNDQVLAFANRSMGTSYSSPNLVLAKSRLDEIDGYPRTLLMAACVLVVEPIPPDEAARHSLGTVMAARRFLAGEGIARAFLRLPESFHFDEGLKLSVLERYRPNTQSEIRELAEALRRARPDLPELFTP
jgi:hypothetical protein